MAVLSPPMLKEMIKESYNRINKKKEYLNDLNVFPVPDGDTGLNMTITMSKVVEELEKADDLSIKNAAKAIAKGAFVGAKGNSGVILSQFFVGFAKSIEDKDSITTEIFANALVSGSERAYKAVTNPKEGTILTVVKETADEALLKATEGLSWREVVEACYNRAQKATADTPNLLKDLKDAGVIDAGALGFVYLIQGWLFVIANSFDGPKVISMNKSLEGLHNKVDTNQSVNDLLFQYCTEALIYDCDDTEENVKSNFDDKGDSLIVISDEGSLKLHIHTNSPNDIINQFAKFGKLKAAKIDDMKSQTLIAH